jgi:hypothetical protein
MWKVLQSLNGGLRSGVHWGSREVPGGKDCDKRGNNDITKVIKLRGKDVLGFVMCCL